MWYLPGRPATSLQEHQIGFRMGYTMRNLQKWDGDCYRAASTNKKHRNSLFHPAALSNLTYWDVSGHRRVVVVYESLGRVTVRCHLVCHLGGWQQRSEIHERGGCVGVHFEAGPANVVGPDWGSGLYAGGTLTKARNEFATTPLRGVRHMTRFRHISYIDLELNKGSMKLLYNKSLKC
ncbi:hypothetical protein BDM02DRAFT_2077412 [Thelephora ganbajun]|uniref:Uncharacterized protein n=1 Tax=Thelephora ganbajun TaxID=370292 RepID=A0ACB6YYX1_THEGA|nr:hypothetical protein BDM02DRAFT_2077412 [Thelephora ganbajun]